MATDDTLTLDEQELLLDDVVSTLAAVDTTIHQLEATRSALLAVAQRIADGQADDPSDFSSLEMAHRAVAAEIGAALHMSDRTVEAQMGDAMLLAQRFPATAAAFGAGLISKAHARMILTVGSPIESSEGRAVFEQHVLERAKKESVGRVRPFAKQMAERVRGVSFSQRHAEAKRRRQVWVTDEDDGESTLHVNGSTTVVHGIFDRLSQMAHSVKTHNDRAARASTERSADAGADAVVPDDRTLGMLRCDLAADLLLTGTPSGHDADETLLSGIQAVVEITVPVLTVTDPLDEAPPAHLAGICPVDPQTARILAGNAPGWDRVMTDPITGAVLATDRYRPTAEMRRHLRSRDRRCRFIGCNITARKTDDDHDVDYALGGATDAYNLSGKCRRHHMMKHHTAWKVEHRRDDVLVWTSPTGRVYTDRPPGVPGHVTFEDVAQRVEKGRPRTESATDDWAEDWAEAFADDGLAGVPF